jgi:ribosomal protein S18 acetylase RimI-like enzyme
MVLKGACVIRPATTKDAEQFCEVIRTSITELCHLDHQGDPKEINDWLSNKTVSNYKAWIEHSSNKAFVAEINGDIVGVSTIGYDGYVFLCYVLPEVKGKGIGSQLLQAAEESVKNKGVASFSLESTKTAQGFYELHGYSKVGESEKCLKYEKVVKP